MCEVINGESKITGRPFILYDYYSAECYPAQCSERWIKKNIPLVGFYDPFFHMESFRADIWINQSNVSFQNFETTTGS